MPPQKRYTLFTTPSRDPMHVAAQVLAERFVQNLMPSFPNLRGTARHEQGAVVIAHVVARSREKAIRKIVRSSGTRRGRFINTCFWAATQGIGGITLVAEKTRRKDGEWVSLPDLYRLEVEDTLAA